MPGPFAASLKKSCVKATRGRNAKRGKRLRHIVRTACFLDENRGHSLVAWAAKRNWRLTRQGILSYLFDFDDMAGDGGSTDTTFSNPALLAPFMESIKATAARADPIFNALQKPTWAKTAAALESVRGFGGTGFVTEHIVLTFAEIDKDVGVPPWTPQRGGKARLLATVGPNPRKLFDSLLPELPHSEALTQV